MQQASTMGIVLSFGGAEQQFVYYLSKFLLLGCRDAKILQGFGSHLRAEQVM